MEYLLFEKGEVLTESPTPQQLHAFLLPLNTYWGSYELRKAINLQLGKPILEPKLNALLQTIKGAKESLGLGIRINNEFESKQDFDPANIREELTVDFCEVSKNMPVDFGDSTSVYIVSRETLEKVNSIESYQYGRYSDGRLVVYLFAKSEADRPIRIPSE